MGLINWLLNKLLGGNKSKTTTTTVTTTPSTAPQQPVQQQSVRGPKYPPMPADMKAHFDAILKEEFSEYEVLENVPVKEIDDAKDGRPYTYVLVRMGRPVAAIMLTRRGQSYKNREFVGAKKAAESQGIAFFNFFMFFANERGYVVNRIKGAI